MASGAIKMKPVHLAVECLFPASCPSAIFRRVIPIVVNSINAIMSAGARTHVVYKCGKTFAPERANTNPSSAISMIVMHRGDSASVNHRAPNAIQRVASVKINKTYAIFSGCRTVFQTCFFLQAPARFDQPMLEVTGAGDFIAPAITSAHPLCAALPGEAVQYCQPAKNEARHV